MSDMKIALAQLEAANTMLLELNIFRKAYEEIYGR